jgi:hypothetical protein
MLSHRSIVQEDRTRSIVIRVLIGFAILAGLAVLLVLGIGFLFFRNWLGFFDGGCYWSGEVHAWVDLNQNGQRDEDEPPLAGVNVSLIGLPQNYSVRTDGSTARGQVRIRMQGNAEGQFGWLGCYSMEASQVQAVIPEGFRLSTESLVPLMQKPVASFGFVPLGETRVSPAPPEPVCQSFPSDGMVNDIVIAPDGIIWVASSHAITTYNPSTSRWKSIGWPTTIKGTIDEIHPAQDGTILVSVAVNERRAYWFDGQAWSLQGMGDGLLTDTVYDAVVMPSGDVWYATSKGMAYFNKIKQEWLFYTWSSQGIQPITDQYPYPVINAELGHDGAVWFSNTHFFAFVVLDENGEFVWGSYPSADSDMAIRPASVETFNPMAVDERGRVWFNEYAFYDPVVNTWTKTTVGQLNDQLATPFDIRPWAIAGAKGGGAWFGAGDELIFMPDLSAEDTTLWQVYNELDGLNGKTITELALESEGIIWIGTYDGLVRCEIDTGY